MRRTVSPTVWSCVILCGLLTLLPGQAVSASLQQGPSESSLPNNKDALGLTDQAQFAAVNQHTFNIPFTLNSDLDSIVEVLLFHSSDRGRTWELHSRLSPTAKHFPYSCEHDGEFWFTVRSQNRDGAIVPGGQLYPDLKILVDTRQPELTFDVRPDAAGRVIGAWRADDLNLDPHSLSIQYQSGNDSRWKEVSNLVPPSTGRVFQSQLAWWPEGDSRQLRVRAAIKDKAGNTVVVEREINIPQVANLTRIQANPASHLAQRNQREMAQKAEATQAVDVPARFASTENQLDVNAPKQGESTEAPPPPIGLVNQSAVQPMTPLPVPAGSQVQRTNPNPSQPQVWNSQPNGQTGQGSVMTNSAGGYQWHSRSPEEADRNSQGLVVSEGTTLRQSNDGFNRPLNSTMAATSSTSQSGPGSEEQMMQSQTGAGQSMMSNASFTNSSSLQAGNGQSSAGNPGFSESLLSLARPINSQRFNLDYEVDAVGPSGVKDVTLWSTTDGGQNWRAWGVDEDRTSPFRVEVPQDGLYGFRIVISSNDGLRGRSPRPGDAPDVWLLVDTQIPLAKIVSAPFGEGAEVGNLVIQYQVEDSFPALRPISLSYGRQPMGPWTTIASGLRNEGRHVWKPDLQTPDSVYLRLEARDTAGNLAIDITPQPIDISGLKPRGHIRDVRPLHGTN